MVVPIPYSLLLSAILKVIATGCVYAIFHLIRSFRAGLEGSRDSAVSRVFAGTFFRVQPLPPRDARDGLRLSATDVPA